jgi:hypothetical protein
MSDFTFTSTAECEKCGAYLQSSDEDCDHDGRSVNTQVFRQFGGGRDSLQGVESTDLHKWHALSEKLGDEWWKHEWLGHKESVNAMLRKSSWSSVAELPSKAMAHRAPEELSE